MSDHIEQAARVLGYGMADHERPLCGRRQMSDAQALGTCRILAAAGLLAEPRTKPTREAVAEALFEHSEVVESDSRLTCGCGAFIDGSDERADHVSHLTDIALALWPGRTEAEVAADALRDLRDRVDEIEGTRLDLPDGGHVWIHPARSIREWIYAYMDEARGGTP